MFEKGASLKPCTNCGADAADIYCARCGERQPGHHDLGVAHFAHEVFHEIAHVDSKFFLTLRDLIAKPGFLTEEYFAGRKSRYIPALRLFLVLFALQFLAFTAYSPAAVYSVKSMKKFDFEVLLLSTHSPDSFDGRYFGPTVRAEIIAVLRPLWTF